MEEKGQIPNDPTKSASSSLQRGRTRSKHFSNDVLAEALQRGRWLSKVMYPTCPQEVCTK